MVMKWNFKQKVSLTGEAKKNLQKIVQFYVWETPVPETSAKGCSFEEMDIVGHEFNTLLAQLRKVSGFPAANGQNWIKSTVSNIENDLEIIDRLDAFDCTFEFAVHTVKTGLSKTEALFYLIRNAFAHGGFRICTFNGETFYALESKDKGKLKGRALFKESTLLEWIKVLRGTYESRKRS